MPRTTRQNILLRHDQTLGAIEKAMSYVAELREAFQEPHPDYAEGYKNILVILITAHDFMQKMKSFV